MSRYPAEETILPRDAIELARNKYTGEVIHDPDEELVDEDDDLDGGAD